jgi:ribosomal protein L40E
MEVLYRTRDARFTFKVQGEVKSVFEQIGQIQEVFEAVSQCEMDDCHSTDLRFRVRENGGNKFYEVVCRQCGARFAYGQHKKGETLFPKYKDGWSRYSGDAPDGDEMPAAA